MDQAKGSTPHHGNASQVVGQPVQTTLADEQHRNAERGEQHHEIRQILRGKHDVYRPPRQVGKVLDPAPYGGTDEARCIPHLLIHWQSSAGFPR